MGAVDRLRRIARGESDIDFVGRIRTWMLISGVVIVVSMVGLTVRKLNLGLAFRGGSSFSVPVAAGTEAPPVREVKDRLEGLGVAGAQVQISRPLGGGEQSILVQAHEVGDTQVVAQTLARIAGQLRDGQPDPNAVSIQDVGPKWGQQISRKAIQGVIVFLVVVVIYISLRLEPKMAATACIALFHDVLSTAGLYSLVGFEVSPASVIAILTILGYSLYDTVVVFDRIRENTQNMTTASKVTYSDVVNRSVKEVFMRSINTSLTSVLPAGGLLFVGAFLLGAETLKDLALALLIGIGVSAYSSIFVAAPILAVWKEREPRYQQMRARIRGGGRPAVPAVVGVGGMGPAPSPGEEEAQPRASYPEARPAPRPRRRRRGKRRR